MEVIPAIDLRGGRVVNLRQGDYARETVFGEDAAAVAGRFAGLGARRIHVVDLDAAREGCAPARDSIQRILEAAAEVPVQLGGGIRSLERVEEVLGLGVGRAVMGTAALESPELLEKAADRYPGRIVLALDARRGRVAVRGWRETSDVAVGDLADRFGPLPLAAILHTDIDRDGMLEGPDVEGTAALARRSANPVIASGGVSSIDDLLRLARTRVIAGAIVGRAVYTGGVDLAAAIRRVEAC